MYVQYNVSENIVRKYIFPIKHIPCVFRVMLVALPDFSRLNLVTIESEHIRSKITDPKLMGHKMFSTMTFRPISFELSINEFNGVVKPYILHIIDKY